MFAWIERDQAKNSSTIRKGEFIGGRDESEERLIIIVAGAKVNALQFNFYDAPEREIALSHGADADTLDRSAIRFAFQEDIEFPGFRRSNQFVAIRAAVDSGSLRASFYEIRREGECEREREEGGEREQPASHSL